MQIKLNVKLYLGEDFWHMDD